MKTKASFLLIAGVIILGGVGLIANKENSLSSGLDVKPLDDKKGVFVGEWRPQYQQSDPSKWTTETRAEVEAYEASVKAINDSWAYRRKAELFVRDGKYEAAIEAYKKAYDISANKVFFGLGLVSVYESAGQYEEALALLDDIESIVNLVEIGKQRFAEIRERLMAAIENP